MKARIIKFNETDYAFNGNTLHSAVIKQSMLTPESVAIRDKNGVMDYQSLTNAALNVTQKIINLELPRETAVGVFLPRDRNIPISLLGIMAADCAYIPLDLKHPGQRTALLLEIADVKYVITTADLAERLPKNINAILIDEEIAIDKEDLLKRISSSMPNQLAYFIFTSGSTGIPKGVMIEHGNALALLEWAHKTYSFTELSQVASGTSITFDLSVFEIFSPLTVGGCVHILEDNLSLHFWPQLNEITLINTVPSVINEIIKLGRLPKNLTVINLAGEPFSMHLFHELRQQCPTTRIFNLYGPSEDTTYSTFDEICNSDTHPTIGTPLTGKHVYLLDNEGKEVTSGEAGEIYVAGLGVARGYYNRPDLNHTFMRDWANPETGRMYRTGDYGKKLDDGRLIYLGRRDDQIKIRGHRIEMGEIDVVIRQHPDVNEAALVVVDSETKGKFLRCALVLRNGTNINTILTWAATQLPLYMLPSEWMAFDILPRLPNGKIDRNYIKHHDVRIRNSTEEKPVGEIEIRLASLWSQLLDGIDVYRSDNFFALGGYSLLIARLSHDIKNHFNVNLSVTQLLATRTLFSQAQLIVEQANEAQEHQYHSLTKSVMEGPCSPSQSRIWTLDKLSPGSPRYNIPIAFQIAGPFDKHTLTSAINILVKRHPILRTVYVETPQRLWQKTSDLPSNIVHQITVTGPTEEAAWDKALELANTFSRTTFDLMSEIPFKVLIIEVKEHLHLMVILTHHIAVDGTINTLIQDLSRAYNNAKELDEHSPLSYLDYCYWLKQHDERHYNSEALAYWQKQLNNPPPELKLPGDRSKKQMHSDHGRLLTVSIPQNKSISLTQLCRKHQVSIFHGLLALTWGFLSRLTTDTQDILLTAPLLDFPNNTFIGTVGNFVNTVILRGNISAESDTVSLLKQAQQRTLEAIQHGHIPYEKVLDEVKGLRSPNGMLVLNIMLSLLQESSPLNIENTAVSHVPIDLHSSRFSLGFFFRLSNSGLELNLEYDTSLFNTETVECLAQTWLNFAGEAIENETAKTNTLSLLSEKDRQKILYTWNETRREYQDNKLIHQLFENSARNNPKNIAIAGPGVQICYGELESRANQLAHIFQSKKIATGSRIAILCERGPQLVIAILAILKAGCVYVPFDPSSPSSRYKTMVDIASISCIVTDDTFAEKTETLCASSTTPLKSITIANEETTNFSSTPPITHITSDNLAYIIFTSGTTGEPKAVFVKHKPVINLIEWVNKTFAVCSQDKLLCVSSIGFDLSVYDVLGILAAGGTIRIASQDEIRNPSALANIIATEEITFWNSTPIAMDQCVAYFIKETNPSLRLAFLSGDWIPVTLPQNLRIFFPDLTLVGLGGATEAVIWSNYFVIENITTDQTSIPYGKPIQNARYYILDKMLQPVPIGVEGDLFIGGEVLAEGYFGNSEKTAYSYIPDPFGLTPSARMYRTGDKARFFTDGNIEFRGRQDTQVKINGYRIEISEIETALMAQPYVTGAFVAVKGERHNYWLCAYIATSKSGKEAIMELRENLRAHLPEYMIPATFVCLPAFPLTANGKLNKRALPEPNFEISMTSNQITPGNEYERKIGNIWRKILKCKSVGITDNFFDVGGNSIKLIQTHRELEEATGHPIPIVMLFQYPTIRSLASWLAGDINGDEIKTNARDLQRSSGPRKLLQQRKQRITANNEFLRRKH